MISGATDTLHAQIRPGSAGIFPVPGLFPLYRRSIPTVPTPFTSTKKSKHSSRTSTPCWRTRAIRGISTSRLISMTGAGSGTAASCLQRLQRRLGTLQRTVRLLLRQRTAGSGQTADAAAKPAATGCTRFSTSASTMMAGSRHNHQLSGKFLRIYGSGIRAEIYLAIIDNPGNYLKYYTGIKILTMRQEAEEVLLKQIQRQELPPVHPEHGRRFLPGHQTVFSNMADDGEIAYKRKRAVSPLYASAGFRILLFLHFHALSFTFLVILLKAHRTVADLLACYAQLQRLCLVVLDKCIGNSP